MVVLFKLIKLEWKKNNIGKYIRNAVILSLLLGVFIFSLAFLGIANDPDGTLDAAPGADMISAPIELFTNIAYLIFTGVMLSAFIVSVYKNKTMNLMFSYPIKRQKILVSQMMAVWIFNFIFLILTKVCIYACVFIGLRFMQSSFGIDFDMTNPSFYMQIIVRSFAVVGMSFIALFVGMAMKSSKATIVTSFLLIFLTQANVGDFTMAGNSIFSMILTIISFCFAFLSIYNVEVKDL